MKIKKQKIDYVKLARERLHKIKEMEISDLRTQENFYETLKENERLESELKELKTHLRLIAKFSDYESLGYKL